MTAQDAINRHLAIPTGRIRLFAIASGLRLEIKLPGFRYSARTPKCSTILRQQFGLKGKPERLLAQFEALLFANGVNVPTH